MIRTSLVRGMRRTAALLVIGAALAARPAGAADTGEPQPLQPLIDAAPEGAVLRLAPGEYAGPAVIGKPLTVEAEAEGAVTVASADERPAIAVTAAGVTVRGLRIEQAGGRDSPAVLVTARGAALEGLDIVTDGYGIRLERADRSVVRGSMVRSSRPSGGRFTERRNGIDLYETHDAVIQDNTVASMYDAIYIENSDNVRITGNAVESSRYGIHVMYSDGTVIAGNDGRMNVTGAMVMTVDGVLLEGNIFAKQSENVNSQGILLFAAKNSVVRGNVVSGNRVGIYVEGSVDNRIENNEILDNFMGMQLLDSEGNAVTGNQWIGNVADAGAQRSGANRIERNFWDSFSGVDADGDGASDLRYAVNPFFLSVTERRPVFQLLFQSPGMKFLEGLYGADRSGWAVDAAPLMEPARETDRTSRESGRAAGAAGALLLAAACAVMIISRRRTT
ncbi:MAG: ABC transporter substrate-binding protein [Paenibacillaceae bacterium]|nr:MAG: ABC transporter substrate-binding protein [Paenibacillaceae bacterium]